MRRSDDFRAGQRVRIRANVDSDFAGYQGIILFVGDEVCDVKIKYRPKGSSMSSTYIGSFPKKDLESLKRTLDLANFSGQQHVGSSRIWMWTAGAIVILTILSLLLL